MATRAELMQALRNADAAGAADDARQIAQMLSNMPSEEAAEENPKYLGAESAVLNKVWDAAKSTGLVGRPWEETPIGKMEGMRPGSPEHLKAAAELAAGFVAPAGAIRGPVKAVGDVVADVGLKTGKLAEDVAAGARPAIEPQVNTPTLPEVTKTSKDAYKAAEEAGAIVSPSQFKNFAIDINNKLKQSGFNAKIHPQLSGALDEINTHVEAGAALSFQDMDTLRQVTREAIAASKPSQRRLAYKVVNGIDKLIQKTGVGELAQKARDFWSRKSGMEDIQDILDVAARKDGDKGPRYIQQKFTKIQNKPELYDRYTPEQQELIDKIANTGLIEGVARAGAPTKDWTAIPKLLLSGGVGSLAGPAGTVGLPLAALGVKAASNAARKSNVVKLQESIARGGEKEKSLWDRLYMKPADRAAVRGGIE